MRTPRFLLARRRDYRALEVLEPRHLLAPVLSATVEGIDINENDANAGGLATPPDPFGAVGPTHLVSVVNWSLEWHTKAGVQENSESLESFFASVAGLDRLFDPKVIYDQHAGRFVVVALELQTLGSGDPVNGSRILAAVSDDSDPNGTWHYQAIDALMNLGDLDSFADYPGLGVDEEAVYIAATMFTIEGGLNKGPRVWILHKDLADGWYAGDAPTFTVHNPAIDSGFAGQIFSTQPAHLYGTLPGAGGTYLVSYAGLTNGVGEQVLVVRVDNPTTTPTFVGQKVEVGDIQANDGDIVTPVVDAPQLGGAELIDTGDPRTINAVWRDGFLYTAATIMPTSGPDVGQATAHWFKLDTSDPDDITVADQGNVGGEDIAEDTSTFYPAVAVDAAGNMAIGFAASAPTIYGGAYYTGRLVGAPAGTVEPAAVLAEGEDYYFRNPVRNRWGDYSGVAFDPAAARTFWVFNQYALPKAVGPEPNGRWGTRWGKFTFPNVGPTVSGFGSGISYTENAAPKVVSAGVTVVDPDSANFAGGTLTVDFSAGGKAEDRLTILTAGSVSTSGSSVSVSGVVIGTFTGGVGTTDLVVTLDADATPFRVRQVLRNVAYSNVSDSPFTTSRTVRAKLTDGDGGTSASVTKTVSVSAANDAPVLSTAGSPSLGSISEDATAPAGTLVQSFAASAISDADAGALKGIAVVSASSFNGTWQYKLLGSSTWVSMGTVSETSARLLPSDSGTKVRFIPNDNFNGSVTLSYRAWDRTLGSVGGTINASVNKGGTKSCSTAKETASLAITAVNDKPVISLSGTIPYEANDPAIVLAATATVTDVDSANFAGGLLRLRYTMGASSSNRLAIGGAFTVVGNNVKLAGTTIGVRTSSGFGTSELKITLNVAATKSIVQQLLRSITFKTVGGSPGTRKIAFSVSDGDGGTSTEKVKTVNVA